ncbi:MAG: hypothetical protein O4751_07330 [Trichodesmium sp. St2_bin6]|uniref:hypothetical protein n=1 Tax=Trichodesmium erythraeum TaxID=1206 RepID=UPI0002E233FE|nr:hypothetical protein [Trichodesmium sp. St2_bin6]MDE5102856.1 hypothetical protein [Trichodesmium sp. St19_bin2]
MANSKLLILDEAIAHQKKHHKLVKHPFFLSKPRIHLGMINLLLHSVKLQKNYRYFSCIPLKAMVLCN